LETGRLGVWINASDIYSRTPFVFGATAFSAICSDLSTHFPKGCNDPLPVCITKARDDRNAPPMLSSFAKAIRRYHDSEIPYIELLDGGLVDNFGLPGFTIARLSADTPYGLLSP
jgi:NTE family protein